MTEFQSTYTLTRQRFDDAVNGLNHEQLNWRLHPDALTIAEMAIHLAGVETWFSAQLLALSMSDEFELRVIQAATDGSVTDNPFPFAVEEMTPETVSRAMSLGRDSVAKLFIDLNDKIREMELKSALGPIIDGNGALARIAAHPFYHQGQIYMIKTAPGFPK
jgi:hypothetical protein